MKIAKKLKSAFIILYLIIITIIFLSCTSGDGDLLDVAEGKVPGGNGTNPLYGTTGPAGGFIFYDKGSYTNG